MPHLALDQILLVSGLLLGVLAAGYGALARDDAWEGEAPAEPPSAPASVADWRGVALGVVVALALFLGTLPQRPPFSPGGRLGIGILVGATSAVVAAALFARRRSGAPATSLGAAGLALIAASGLMLAYRGYPNDALFGAALGQAIVALCIAPRRVAGDGRNLDWKPTALLPLLTALLAAGVSLAIDQYRGFKAAERLVAGEKLWWAGPLVVFGCLLIGQIAGRALARRPVLQVLLTAVVAGALLGVFAGHFPRYLPLLPPVAAGFLSGALLIALAAAPGGPTSGLLGASVALVLLVAAYRFAAGYGIALAALGFAGTALAWEARADFGFRISDFGFGDGSDLPKSEIRNPKSEIEAQPLPAAGLALLVLAALFRAYYIRYKLDETSVYLTAHYTLIGLITGALAPLAFGLRVSKGFLATEAGEPRLGREADRGGGRPPGEITERGLDLLSRLATLGAAFLLPALMVVFWGIRACAGLVLGLSLGQAFLLWVRLAEGDGTAGVTARVARAAELAPILILALTCVQGLDFFEGYAGSLTRIHRIAIVLLLASLIPLAVLLRTLSRRRGTT